MKIENEKIVKAVYDLMVKDENGAEEIMEKATEEMPLVYCHGEGMMLPAFENALLGKETGDSFDFVIPCQDAYGDYDEKGVMELPKRMFYNGDGEFDAERVFAGNVIPMHTMDGQVVQAFVAEVKEESVTIDLNHPYAGVDLHFAGRILEVREATPEELDQIRHPHHCCGKGKGGCGKHKDKKSCGEGECGKGECGKGECGGCGDCEK